MGALPIVYSCNPNNWQTSKLGMGLGFCSGLVAMELKCWLRSDGCMHNSISAKASDTAGFAIHRYDP
jgi:hypothetical protein